MTLLCPAYPLMNCKSALPVLKKREKQTYKKSELERAYVRVHNSMYWGQGPGGSIQGCI
jgi:hypothetical protein